MEKRQIFDHNLIPLYDNACPHTANLTCKKLEECHWTTLEHAPKLSLCDCHIFKPLKEAVRGKQFDDYAASKAFIHNWLRICSCSFYEYDIKKHLTQWGEQ